MSSPEFQVFERLIGQIDIVMASAARDEAAGHADAPPVLRRASIVLAMAAVDSYLHEKGISLLVGRGQAGPAEGEVIASYLGLSAGDVTGASAAGFIRYRLSYKTLVAPDQIDKLLTAAGRVPQDVWLQAAVALNTRPDRLQRELLLLFDRRNQIAHEGDWDPAAFDVRMVQSTHVDDCVGFITRLMSAFEDLL